VDEPFSLFLYVVVMILVFSVEGHLYRWPYGVRVQVLHVRKAHSSDDCFRIILCIFDREHLLITTALVILIDLLFRSRIVDFIKGLRILSELGTEKFFNSVNSSDLYRLRKLSRFLTIFWRVFFRFAF